MLSTTTIRAFRRFSLTLLCLQQKLGPARGLPIILDASPEVVDSVEIDDGYAPDQGLLDRADVQAALLSMSGYGKHHTSDATGKSSLSTFIRDRAHVSKIAINRTTQPITL